MNKELEEKLQKFQNEISEHAEYIVFLKPKDKREEIVMINGNAANLAAVIAISRIQNDNVRSILKASNAAYKKFKDMP